MVDSVSRVPMPLAVIADQLGPVANYALRTYDDVGRIVLAVG